MFASAYAANMANEMLRTIRLVRWFATAIMVIAMIVSYSHQTAFLSGLGTPALGAWLIPGAVDCLTILCVKVIGTAGMAQPARKTALRVLVFPVLASGVINFLAPGALVTKSVFVLAVLMIPAAELVASKIKPDFTAMDLLERDIAPQTATETEIDEELRLKRSEAARRGAETRKRNAAKAPPRRRTSKVAVAELEAAYAMPDAPVSPAA
jgi:hypothetical protein